jgi:putative DNA primase/helicase
MKRAALEYAEKFGFAVFPCKVRGKQPLTKHGCRDASKDLKAISDWWNRYPDANIGIATGSVSGVVVLDVDTKASGRETLAVLEDEHGHLPDAPTVLTGGGGLHIYFRDPGGLRNSAGMLGQGLDFRADGGYVIAEPSIHPNGNEYRWEISSSIRDVALPEIPRWLLDRINAPTKPHFEMPARVGEGKRNETLFRIGRSLKARGVAEAEILAELQSANGQRCDPPLDGSEIAQIAHSAATTPDRAEFIGWHNRVGQRASGAPHVSEEWPEPEELGSELLPVPSLKEALIPEALRPWVLDTAERFQCPADYFAVAGLVEAGQLLGRRIALRPKQHDRWYEHANLWGGIVAPPGFMKSPAIREAFQPLFRLEKQARTKYEDAKRVAEVEREIAESNRTIIRNRLRAKDSSEAERERLARQLSEITFEEPICRRYIVNDVTVEKVGELLNQNPDGLALLCDELSGWMGQMEQQEYVNARAFYLSAWSGKASYTYDRIGRGSLFIEAACLSVFGALVPGTLERYLRATFSGERADGFIQRFQLLVYPDLPPKWEYVDRPVAQGARERAFAALERLGSLTAADFGAVTVEDEPPFVRFSTQAQYVWIAAHEWCMKLARSDEEHPVLRSHFSKYPKLLAALALIFHALTLADGHERAAVEQQSIDLAWGWAQYMEHHARRIYQLALSPGETAARLLLEKLREQKLPIPFTVRDVQRKCWAGLRAKPDVEVGLQVLEECGWVRSQQRSTGGAGGRPTHTFLVNPKLPRPQK